MPESTFRVRSVGVPPVSDRHTDRPQSAGRGAYRTLVECEMDTGDELLGTEQFGLGFELSEPGDLDPGNARTRRGARCR